MNDLKYSIVVPTRNRSKYLEHSLRTVLFAGRADYEVVVSDNSDAEFAPDNERIVRQINHPAVRYVRPPDVPLAMSRHWEWAIRQTAGAYVTVVGDDDALLPYTLSAIDTVLQQTNHEVLTWDWVTYYWPDSRTRPAQLLIRPNQLGAKLSYEIVNGAKLLRNVLSLATSHFELPMIYKSFFSRGMIERMLPDGGGGINSQSPDIYSGMVIAHLAPTICAIRTPLGIGGVSGKSNGAAFLTNGCAVVQSDFSDLNSAQHLQWPASVPEIPVSAAATAESYVRCCERFGESALKAGYNPMVYLKWYCESVLGFDVPGEIQHKYFDRIENCYPPGSSARAYVQKRRQRVNAVRARRAPKNHQPGLHPWGMIIATREFGIETVADVCELVTKLLPVDPTEAVQISEKSRLGLNEFVPPALHATARTLRDMMTTLRIWSRL